MRNEWQAKFRGDMTTPAELLRHGAELVGEVVQRDFYFQPEEAGPVHRIRQENDRWIVSTEEKLVSDTSFRIRRVDERLIDQAAAEKLLECHGVMATVCKQRAIYYLQRTIIVIDDVEHLGRFLKVRAQDEAALRETLELLAWSATETLHDSYLEMVLECHQPRWLQLILRWHDRVGELAFGVTSGVLTTVGTLAGVASATQARLPVIAAIAAIAVADSGSDAFGMYLTRISERGSSRAAALRYALGTLLGKFLFPVSCIIPLAVAPLAVGIAIDIIWGGVALALLTAEQAIVSQQTVWRQVARTLSLAAVIIGFSASVGWLIDTLAG